MIRKLFTRTERRILLGLLVFILGIPAAFIVPIGGTSYSYRSVTDKDTSPWGGDDRIRTREKHDYVLTNGKLYLPVQSTSFSLLAPLVHMEEWDVDRLKKFVAENPNLSSLLPDPASPDGGVAWIPLPPRPWPWKFRSAENEGSRAAEVH